MSSDEPQPGNEPLDEDAPAREVDTAEVNRCEFPIGPATALDPQGQLCSREIPDEPGKRGPKSKYCQQDGHIRQYVVRERAKYGLLLGGPGATTTTTTVPVRKVSDAQGTIGPLIAQYEEVATTAAAKQAELASKINRALAQVTDPEAAVEEVGEIGREAQKLIAEAEDKRLAALRDLRQVERDRDTYRERAEDAESTTAEALAKEQAALEQAETERAEKVEALAAADAKVAAAEEQARTYIQEVTTKATADVELHLERARLADQQQAEALAELERIRAEAVAQIEQANADATQRVEQAQADATERVEQAKAEAEEQIRAIRLEAVAEIEEARNQADARVAAAEAAAAAQVEEAKAEATRLVTLAREDAQEKVDTARSTAAEQIETMRLALDKAEAAATASRREASDEASARIRAEAEKDAAVQQAARGQESITRLEADLAAARAQARTDVERLQADLDREKTGRDADRATHAEQITQLTQALAGVRQAAEPPAEPVKGAAKKTTEQAP